MVLQSISQVSKSYDISARMLRYYEQIGLLKSLRNADKSYRVYDETALKRIQLIIFLRKLQIPVKRICAIIDNPDSSVIIGIFNKSIAELEKEITALSVIKSILENIVSEIAKITGTYINLDMLNDDSVINLARSLCLVQKNVKEKLGMNELNKAAEILNKLKDVRVVYLPPMTVASAFCTGDNPEEQAWRSITDFISRKDLLTVKPDARLFKIDHNNATGEVFGYEIWISIPEKMDIPAPLIKKEFHGGLYAVHVVGENRFEIALGLQDWINENDKYQYDYDLTRCDPQFMEIDSFGGLIPDLDEVLNLHNYQTPGFENQTDMLIPIKYYTPPIEAPVEIPGSKEKCGFKASVMDKGKFTIIGFTKIMTQENNPEMFENELKTDGRLDILNKYRKPGARILGFGSIDMDSQIRGGWRWTICLAESDITDTQAFAGFNPYTRTIDASKWVIFEYMKGDQFNDHSVCPKLGYTWNGIISGSFIVYPDCDTGKTESDDDKKNIMHCWYPVK